MKRDLVQTGYQASNPKNDTSAVVNPYYNTTSSKDSLIDQMKNHSILIS